MDPLSTNHNEDYKWTVLTISVLRKFSKPSCAYLLLKKSHISISSSTHTRRTKSLVDYRNLLHRSQIVHQIQFSFSYNFHWLTPLSGQKLNDGPLIIYERIFHFRSNFSTKRVSIEPSSYHSSIKHGEINFYYQVFWEVDDTLFVWQFRKQNGHKRDDR